jgi:outer membrane protein, heavy metal efflux system
MQRIFRPVTFIRAVLSAMGSGTALVLGLALAAFAPSAFPQGAGQAAGDAVLKQLIAEAIGSNPDIRAARSENEAARHRIAPAGALDDPMLEAGLLNVPTNSWSLSREDMTMKMLGISQRLPAPGKRALRREVAAKDAQAVEHAYQETVNRVARDIRIAYYELGLAVETARLIQENTRVLEQFLRIADGRYSVGQGNQADVLKAQTQLARMSEELLRIRRDVPVLESELARLLGRSGDGLRIAAALPPVRNVPTDFSAAREAALIRRPQLIALRSLLDKANAGLDLARKESDPDFDLKFSYGQRDKAPDGMPRADLVSITVAINLPVWGKDKIQPRIAESQAMRNQAMSLYQAQQNEIFARLRQQLAIAEQSRKSVELFDTSILPQARLAVESALASYRVNRVDLLALLDSQMSLYSYGIGRAASVAGLHKAAAEIDLITGTDPQ